MTEEEEAASLLIGRTIAGKFVIEAVIGVGAMGIVYRARQPALDKTVAIKVMHIGLITDKTSAGRFHREAKAASRLDHPNSIRIHDFGQEPDGLLYIAMDYLDGPNLLDIIKEESPLPPQRIVNVLSQALSALAMAHELGIMHRDLKPENIMVLRGTSDDGSPIDRVKVCDFGIAKLNEPREGRGDGVQISSGGLVLGTPPYMPPEQAYGEPVDARSDLYSMGVVLYQMLTGRVPFDAPTPLAVLYKVVNDEPARPSSLRPSVHLQLEAVCLKAMSKNPEDRYQSARQMRAALRASVGLEPQLVADGEPPSSSAGGKPMGLREMTPTPRGQRAVPLPVLTSRDGSQQNEPLPSPRRWAWLRGTIIAAMTAFLLVLAWLYRHPTVETASPVLSQSRDQKAQPNVGSEERPHAPSTAPVDVPRSSPATTPSPVTVRPRKAKPVETQELETPAAPATPPPPPAPMKAPVTVSAPPQPTPAINESRRGPDPAAAYVEIGSATGTTGTTTASVNKALAPLGSKLTACYRSAPAPLPTGSTTLHVETNEDGVITDARLDQSIGAALRNCIVTAVRGRKISNVDTGSASADILLMFKSR